jgi:hypothetical protein
MREELVEAVHRIDCYRRQTTVVSISIHRIRMPTPHAAMLATLYMLALRRGELVEMDLETRGDAHDRHRS